MAGNRDWSKEEAREGLRSVKEGDFVPPPDLREADEQQDALPEQEEFWRPPTRFGSVPVEKEPLGWDRRKGFRKLFPSVYLPFQVVERVKFGHPDLEPNRLFWGDNLHVMRQLPNESIHLIYIDPPFFSGKQYNVIFGDQNELRSFSDIWEGGMPGYLIWLNARLHEMKRLLKNTGSIYVHCDWHASHYIKVEMDKVFGAANFLNDIAWVYGLGGSSSRYWPRKHDSLLMYSKTPDGHYFKADRVPATSLKMKGQDKKAPDWWMIMNYMEEDVYEALFSADPDVWDIPVINNMARERVGYPTQKPEALLRRVIMSSCPPDGTVADFFVGGGTTAVVAQELGRRWIACDQSRVAVAITAARVTRLVEEKVGKIFPVPDFTIEYWGVYEAKRLAEMPSDQFRGFVLQCFGGTAEGAGPGIHGYKGAIPLWIGDPDPKKAVAAADVQAFANAIRKTLRYKQDNLRDGMMLAWAFRPDAMEAAERLRRLEQVDVNFIRLEMIRIDSPRFREHVAALSTEKADYESFLTFVQPPRVEVGYKRIGTRTYRFDVSETVVMNPGAKIINVQWDFSYRGRFSSTPEFSFVRGKKKEPSLQVDYEFPKVGRVCVACKVQDDMGGEGLWTGELDVI